MSLKIRLRSGKAYKRPPGEEGGDEVPATQVEAESEVEEEVEEEEGRSKEPPKQRSKRPPKKEKLKQQNKKMRLEEGLESDGSASESETEDFLQKQKDTDATAAGAAQPSQELPKAPVLVAPKPLVARPTPKKANANFVGDERYKLLKDWGVNARMITHIMSDFSDDDGHVLPGSWVQFYRRVFEEVVIPQYRSSKEDMDRRGEFSRAKLVSEKTIVRNVCAHLETLKEPWLPETPDYLHITLNTLACAENELDLTSAAQALTVLCQTLGYDLRSKGPNSIIASEGMSASLSKPGNVVLPRGYWILQMALDGIKRCLMNVTNRIMYGSLVSLCELIGLLRESQTSTSFAILCKSLKKSLTECSGALELCDPQTRHLILQSINS